MTFLLPLPLPPSSTYASHLTFFFLFWACAVRYRLDDEGVQIAFSNVIGHTSVRFVQWFHGSRAVCLHSPPPPCFPPLQGVQWTIAVGAAEESVRRAAFCFTNRQQHAWLTLCSCSCSCRWRLRSTKARQKNWNSAPGTGCATSATAPALVLMATVRLCAHDLRHACR